MPELNQLTTGPLSLLDYDAFILKDRKESADDLRPAELLLFSTGADIWE
jgi:hypothetical protein